MTKSRTFFDQMLTTAEAAKVCGVPESRLIRMRGAGVGPAYFVHHGRLLYRICDLEMWRLSKVSAKLMKGAHYEFSDGQRPAT